MLEKKVICENCGEAYPPGWPHTCDSPEPFPKPTYRERDGIPCGECHLKIGERCDICGIRYVA